MDESGYISINGRIKDMVIRGGENIYPLEIEDFLLTHEEVTDAQVIRFKHIFTVHIYSKKKKNFVKFLFFIKRSSEYLMIDSEKNWWHLLKLRKILI
jgi:acyl-CoA synthetase (AMP-forming)/AMP-acid ligase II